MCNRAIYLSEKLLRLCKSVAAVRLYNSTLEPLQICEEILWQTVFVSFYSHDWIQQSEPLVLEC